VKRKSTLYSTDIIVNGVFNGGDEGDVNLYLFNPLILVITYLKLAYCPIISVPLL